jgi:5,10-methylenetetrahydromethanopterin reductase
MELGALVLGSMNASELRALARDCESWGYDALWVADERFYRDVYAAMAVCALSTERIKLGTGVTDPYSRHPALTAMGIATIDEISGGRAMLGIGAGIAGFKEMGISHSRPSKTIREAIEFIRQFLSNEPVTFEGETLTFDDGVLHLPARVDLPIYIAGKGPLNIRLAGEVADGLIISSCVHDTSIDHTLALLAQGAGKAGRDPASVTLCSRVNVSISEDGDAARQAVKPMIAALLISKKPDFSFLDPMGLSMSPDLEARVLAATYGIDRPDNAAVAAMIPDEFADALAVAGTADEVSASIERMARCGVGQLIAYPLPAPGDDAAGVLRRLATEIMPPVRKRLAGAPA